MIFETLKNIPVEQSVNIVYDLYRIFHKAYDGIYLVSFPDSDLTEQEHEIKLNLLSNIQLDKHLSDKEFLDKALNELNSFQDTFLDEKLNIDKQRGKKLLEEALNPKLKIKKTVRLLGLGIAASVAGIIFFAVADLRKQAKIKELLVLTDKLLVENNSYKTKIVYLNDTVFAIKNSSLPSRNFASSRCKYTIDSLLLVVEVCKEQSEQNKIASLTWYNNYERVSAEYKIFRDSSIADCENSKQFLYKSREDLKVQIDSLRINLDSCRKRVGP